MIDVDDLAGYVKPRRGWVWEERTMEVAWHREFCGHVIHAVEKGQPDEGDFRKALCGKRAVLLETKRNDPTGHLMPLCKACVKVLKPPAAEVTQAGLFE